MIIKFIYSEKATKCCEISTVDLSYVVPVKSTTEISQNFVAFSEYMNFICDLDYILDPEGQPDLTWPNFLAGEPNPTKIGSGLATLMQRYSNPPSKYFELHCAGATSHPIVRISWFFSDNANSKTRVEWREGRCTCSMTRAIAQPRGHFYYFV